MTTPLYTSNAGGVWTGAIWTITNGGTDAYPGQTAGVDAATIQNAVTAAYSAAYHLAGFTVTSAGTFTNTGGAGARAITLTCDTGTIMIDGNLGGTSGPRSVNLVASAGGVVVGDSAVVTMYGSITASAGVAINPNLAYPCTINGNVSAAGSYTQSGGLVTGTVTLNAASGDPTLFAGGDVTGGITISSLATYTMTGGTTATIHITSGVLTTGDASVGHFQNATAVYNNGGTLNVLTGSTVASLVNTSGTANVSGTVTAMQNGGIANITGTVGSVLALAGSVINCDGNPTIGAVSGGAGTLALGTATITATGTIDATGMTVTNTSAKILGTHTITGMVNTSPTHVRAWDGPSIDGGGNVGVDFTAPAPAGPPVGTRAMMGAGV